MDDMNIKLNGILGQILAKVVRHQAKKKGITMQGLQIDTLHISTDNKGDCTVRVAASIKMPGSEIESMVTKYVLDKG